MCAGRSASLALFHQDETERRPDDDLRCLHRDSLRQALFYENPDGAADEAKQLGRLPVLSAQEADHLGMSPQLAPFKIRVNCVRPGYIPTEGTALAFNAEEAERLVELTPLGRPGRADEIGEAVVYFSADSGSWVTGQVLAVDGGMVIPEGVSFEKLCRRLYGNELMDRCTRPQAD